MKQMPLRVAQRRWLFNAVFASVLIPLEVWAALGDSPAGWALWASLPLAAVSWTGWWMNRIARRRQERPDYIRIALLERELLGIEPESLTERYACPELIRKPRVAKRQRRLHTTRGGYMSSDRTIHDLGPFPEASLQKPQPPPGPGAGSPTTR